MDIGFQPFCVTQPWSTLGEVHIQYFAVIGENLEHLGFVDEMRNHVIGWILVLHKWTWMCCMNVELVAAWR